MNLVANYHHLRSSPLWVRGLLAVAGVFAAANHAGAAPPTFAEVKAIVQKHLRSSDGYAPGDLITRKDVEPIFDELIPLGVPLMDGQEELYDDFVPAGSQIARLLSTPSGRAFMHKVKTIPGVYDRMERLSWNPQGKELIEKLIEDPEGLAMFKVLLQPQGSAAIVKYLGSDPSGKNFSLPTGHIYTEAELLKRLEKIHARRKQR